MRKKLNALRTLREQVPTWYWCPVCEAAGRPTGVRYADYAGELTCEWCRFEHWERREVMRCRPA